MSEFRRRSIGELFERNKRQLARFLSRRLGPEDTSDILQETFVRVLRHDRIEAMEDPPSWLRRIALNLARDHVRRRRTEAKYLEFGDPPESAPCDAARPDERVEADERWRLLYAAVEGLPPRCREVFLLYMFESLALGEIAQRLGMSQNMAQKHMRLAVRRCLEALR
jgi:RNA polymerase sigma-70 factor (ECF subfamily)